MKKKSTLFWLLGGAAAAAASVYAAQRIRVYLAWRDEKELEETNREIDRYEDYVHANGDGNRKARRATRAQVKP